jgi:spore maturation protein CgeB
MVYKCNVTSELVARHLNLPQLLMMLSGEKRLRALSTVADLGLELYGTENWQDTYYYDSKINMSHIRKRVYSIEHNQDIYNRSKIGINVPHLQATSGFPWRVMDIMASNVCLVTDYHTDFDRLFGNIPIPTYNSSGEAYEVCRKLLNDENRRKDIVMQCQQVVDSRYRFKHLLVKLEEYSGVRMHI